MSALPKSVTDPPRAPRDERYGTRAIEAIELAVAKSVTDPPRAPRACTARRRAGRRVPAAAGRPRRVCGRLRARIAGGTRRLLPASARARISPSGAARAGASAGRLVRRQGPRRRIDSENGGFPRATVAKGSGSKREGERCEDPLGGRGWCSRRVEGRSIRDACICKEPRGAPFLTIQPTGRIYGKEHT